MNKRVVIVEDEYFASNHLKKIATESGYEVVNQYYEGKQVLNDLETLKNLVFLLDIQLTDQVNGIAIAVELKKRNIPFLFITANSEGETFEEAIQTKPIAYITKPFKEMDILAGLALAFQNMESKIKISVNNETHFINLDNILYLQSDNVYVNIFTTTKTYTARKKLIEIEEELSFDFQRCHRSYIVNLNKITSMKNDTLFINEIEIPLSKKYRTNF